MNQKKKGKKICIEIELQWREKEAKIRITRLLRENIVDFSNS